jgi:hypothetical protein
VLSKNKTVEDRPSAMIFAENEQTCGRINILVNLPQVLLF